MEGQIYEAAQICKFYHARVTRKITKNLLVHDFDDQHHMYQITESIVNSDEVRFKEFREVKEGM